jgi:hypothetical protein
VTKPQRIWRMEARDSEGEPITGPWETKAEAQKRKTDVVDGRFILSAEVVRKK